MYIVKATGSRDYATLDKMLRNSQDCLCVEQALGMLWIGASVNMLHHVEVLGDILKWCLQHVLEKVSIEETEGPKGL